MKFISAQMADTMRAMDKAGGSLSVLEINSLTIGALTSRGLAVLKFPTRNKRTVTQLELTPAGRALVPSLSSILSAPGYFETMAKVVSQKRKDKEAAKK